MSAPTEITVDQVVQSAAKLLMRASLDLLQKDPHQWSTRPCPTCRSITAMIGETFGCYKFQEEWRGKR